MVGGSRVSLLVAAGIGTLLSCQRSSRLANAPELLKSEGGLSAFVNVGAYWTAEDESRLLDTNPAYATLRERRADLSAGSEGHADWPALREHVQTELSSTPAYVAASTALEAELAELEDRLSLCGARSGTGA